MEDKSVILQREECIKMKNKFDVIKLVLMFLWPLTLFWDCYFFYATSTSNQSDYFPGFLPIVIFVSAWIFVPLTIFNIGILVHSCILFIRSTKSKDLPLAISVKLCFINWALVIYFLLIWVRFNLFELCLLLTRCFYLPLYFLQMGSM